MPTRKWFHGQMDSFVSLQIMIPVETLRTLVALERAFVMRGWLRTIHLLQLRTVPAVEPCHHTTGKAVGESANHGHLATRAVHVGHDGTGHPGTVDGR